MVLVIGASSFIGVYTVDSLLENGYEVVATGRNQKFADVYARKGVEYIQFDLEDKDDINKLPTQGVEAVILLAGYLPANAKENLVDNENADKYITINTLGTINLLEYCRKNGIDRMIMASSYADMGGYFGTDTLITEDLPRNYRLNDDHSTYVISKNAATDILEYYNQKHQMKNMVFKFPPVYGVGPHGSLNVNGNVVKSGLQIFIDKAKAGENIEVYGDKDVERDVVYVKDAAKAFVLGIKSENAKGVYNIASGKSVSLEEQAEAVKKVFGNPEVKVIHRPEKPNSSKKYYMSIEKATKDFDYTPEFVDFEKMMIDWKKEETGVYAEIFRDRNDSL